MGNNILKKVVLICHGCKDNREFGVWSRVFGEFLVKVLVLFFITFPSVKAPRVIGILLFALTGLSCFAQYFVVSATVSKIQNLPDSAIAEALIDSSLNYRLVDFDLSYAYAQKGLEYAIRAKNCREIGNAYNFSGIAQHLMANYPKALEFYSSAESTFRACGYKKGLASTYINIGILNQDMGNPTTAIEYNRKSYGISLSIKDSVNAASALNNIATLHSDLNQLDSALFYNFKSLEIRKKLRLKNMISTSLSNIGTIYDAQQKYEMALDYQAQAAAIDSASNNKKSLCISLSNMGSTLIKMDRGAEAKKLLLHAMEIAKELGYMKMQLDIAANLVAAFEKLGQYKEAIEYSSFYIHLKDSLTNEDNRAAFAEMQAKLDNTVQKHEIENLQKDKLIDAEKARRQGLIIYFGTGAIILFSILLIIIFRGYNQKKKINILITEQKNEVELQRNIVELKNREIVDSINYAQRIQQAILLPESEFQKEFADASILFKPKDIVSGDFYWFAESDENKIVALADCTGHGVPGGFMSMLGFEILQDVVLREEIHTTSEALVFLDKKVTDTLNKNSKSYRDGMDMALCAFNKATGKLSFSGANRPLIHISNGLLTTHKPDKHTIGGAIDGLEKVFTSVEIQVKQGDLIYLFTDGFADQFGGSRGKKFKIAAMRELLLALHDKSMAQQKLEINAVFENWKGDLEQVDDVCMIGVKC